MSNVKYSNSHRQGVEVFHSQYYLVATVIHIEYLSSQICVYTHIRNNLEMLIGQKKYLKKLGELCMPRDKEIFRSAIFDTRAVGSSALVYVMNSSFLLLLCFHVITVHWQRELLCGG